MSGIQSRIHIVPSNERADVQELPTILGINISSSSFSLERLPFSPDDLTIGTESEYQTAVQGNRRDVDLPVSISESTYFANISRRVKAGDIARRSVARLEEFLDNNPEGIWENSWIRFPYNRLKARTREVLTHDLKEDKASVNGRCRIDASRFFMEKNGERWLRVPSSYLLKLALIDMLSETDSARRYDLRFLSSRYLNDNSSPETISFYPSAKSATLSAAQSAAEENALRFLLSQLALMYADRAFGLESLGQKVLLYYSPSTPLRIKRLNNLVSDAFYRELFMSPCLSGWDKGYDKHEYMHLCHQVLSRSHLNSIFKLKDAGIITQPLVRMDSISNTSLADNGTHISIGSRMLTRLAAENLFAPTLEKSAGDLVIKIFEHFLPLFPGTFSASPARISYYDFRPENLIGFLAHELDFTHLRMFWRRWVKKAGLDIMGHSILPYGPDWYEFLWKKVFRLKGDFVPDIRLIDYLVALMSTPESPALDGRIGNDALLKRDLAHLGVFDEKMSMYLPYKLRAFSVMGFCGFEGRFYSAFHSFSSDLSDACSLQSLITAWAWKEMLTGHITHHDIPDDPVTESERRQIFFSAAVGLSAVSIREDNPSRFMSDITSLAASMRHSGRYQGQYRLRIREYCLALIALLRNDAALVEMFDAEALLERLEARILEGTAAADKLIHDIAGNHRAAPLRMSADEFNTKAESYYRNELRQANMDEAMNLFANAVERSLSIYAPEDVKLIVARADSRLPGVFIRQCISRMLTDTLSLQQIQSLSEIMMIYLHHQSRMNEDFQRAETPDAKAPIYRQKDLRDHG